MKIEFDKIEELCIDNFKGGEKYYAMRGYDDGNTKIMRGRLIPGASIGQHTHDDSCEIIHVLSGEGVMHMDGKEEILRQGDTHYCPKGGSHTFRNPSADTDLVFLAIVPKQ